LEQIFLYIKTVNFW